MKKALSISLVILALLTLFGCSAPDSLQLDLRQGYGLQIKLLHLNASSDKNRQRIEDFASITSDAQPLEKDISLFAYYPDYSLTITRDGQAVTEAVIDMNGDFVDFHFAGETQLYRSRLSVPELKKLLHQPVKD